MVPTDLEGHAVDVEYSDVHVEDGNHQSRWKIMIIAVAFTGLLVYFHSAAMLLGIFTTGSMTAGNECCSLVSLVTTVVRFLFVDPVFWLHSHANLLLILTS